MFIEEYMLYWGKLIGFLISIIFGNNFSSIIFGILIGSIIDKINEIYNENQYFDNQELIKKLYIKTIFEVMGYISKSKGFISNKDIKMTTDLMKNMNFDKKDILFAQNSFKNGKKDDYPLIYKLNNLYNILITRNDLIDNFIEIQIKIAFINDYLDKKTKKILFIIFNQFNISETQIRYFINNLIINNSAKTFFFKDFFKYYNNNNNSYYNDNFYYDYNHQYNFYDDQYNYYDNQSNYYYNDQNNNNKYYNNKEDSNQLNIDKAYIILGVQKNDSLLKIKRAYRKLMSKYHPDKLVSKGYSPEILEKAKIKTQNIQAAYNLIKKQKSH
ncbi:co-chaperone DjlA [Enterobacteriaceae endosymbiont of Plateumaris consimilis]|uniref:co-chaperone DjlA n=1 Tax=Enterobacteriaceae endosymbiont of Plateumaris consimilis TaxID=2675794 RepID=UPI0014499994|nr:co-chaperone DjlA [Enterobacteriaceae endosymbiont of Plateumaris consimilis]QJC28579.1 co-chaperone DjlA [Enterobacteriaceae endosymbiont of Plateumaris consimilis]